MTEELDKNDGRNFVAPTGNSLLTRVQANENAQTEVPEGQKPEIPTGGLMERVQQVQERRETAEKNPDAHRIAVDAVTTLESAVAKIDPRDMDPIELKQRILETIHGVGEGVINKYPQKPSTFESQFK